MYIIVNLGFYKSYFSHLSAYSMTVHFHGAVIAGWFIIVILQNILALKGNFKWHKYLGWSSVLLAVLIIVSIIGITKMGYLRDINSGQTAEKLNSGLLSSYTNILFFSLFFILALFKRKKVNSHYKYIVAATLILFGPGIGRFVFFNFPEFDYSMFIAKYYGFIIIILLWFIESIKVKKIIVKNDYVLILILFVVQHYIDSNFADTQAWQSIAQTIVNLIY